MDFWKALEDLHKERKRLINAIAVLEDMQGSDEPSSRGQRKGRRGRKTMPPEERRMVAERMRAYWRRRRDGGSGKASSAG